jgi:hypothetical protein
MYMYLDNWTLDPITFIVHVLVLSKPIFGLEVRVERTVCSKSIVHGTTGRTTKTVLLEYYYYSISSIILQYSVLSTGVLEYN